MNAANRQTGVSQIVLLVVIAVALGAAYVAIDLYTGGEKDMLTVETRGVGMISALSAYKRESRLSGDSGQARTQVRPGGEQVPGWGAHGLSCLER